MAPLTTLEAARIARRGTALLLTWAGGATRLCRRIDLAAALGWPSIHSPRFAAVRLAPGGVELELSDGSREFVADDELCDRGERAARGRAADLVVDGAGLLLTAEARDKDPLGLVRDGAVICGGGRILWVGRGADVAAAGFDLADAWHVAAGGRLVTPGLVDCHAHPIFAGDRADEFSRRAAGQSYQEIAAAGGGIAATLAPTRQAGFDDLVALAASRLYRALQTGTTTCEAKSGYDLTVVGELRLLEAALVCDSLLQIDISPTLLGAHQVPPERSRDRDQFVREVCDEMIPAAAARGLASAVDVYCDEGAFTVAEARRVLEAGRGAGLLLRAHAGQFADLGAAQVAAGLGAASADHLEQISAEGIAALASHGVVAVMLPGACVQLGLAAPPVAALRAAGVSLAVASDMNPGTTLCESLPIQMWLATTHYGMTVEETWLGVTREAARVLGRHDRGVLAPGAVADLVIWDAETPAEIPYRYGARLVHQIIKDGRAVRLPRPLTI